MSLPNNDQGPSPLQLLLLVGLSLLITACGFQLRGLEATPQALRPLALECGAEVPRSLCREVRSQLELRQLLAQDGETPAYRLTISDYHQNRRASAITDRAAAAEFELEAGIAMSLISADDVPMMAESRLNTNEVFRGDETRVLAQEREQQSVAEIVQNRLAQQIVQRLTPFTEERIQRIRDSHADDEQAAEP